MKEQELLHHLHEFTEEELFYQRYHIAKNTNGQLETFLSSQDTSYLSRNKYVLPELKSSLDLHFTSESWVWEDPEKDIYIHKHPRYMPEWEFTHDFYELVFMYCGQCDLHISNRALQMKPGYVCIIPPGVSHYISIFDDNAIAFNTKVRKSSFHASFSPILTGNDLLAQFFLNTMYIGDYKDYILFRSTDDSHLKHLFSSVYLEHWNKEKHYPRVMNSLLSIVFYHLMRHHESNLETGSPERNRTKKTEAILGYIESNFRTVSLGELAKKFFFTEQYLSKFIKENTGRTFKEIVRDIRLENARKLLETSSLTIHKISEASGYASTEHFMRQFKAEFHISPAAYRKRNH